MEFSAFRFFNFIKAMWIDIVTQFCSFSTFVNRIQVDGSAPMEGNSSSYSLIQGTEARTPSSHSIFKKEGKSRVTTPSKTPNSYMNSTPLYPRTQFPSSPKSTSSKTPKTNSISTPLNPRTQSPSSPETEQSCSRSVSAIKILDVTPDFVQHTQAIKRRKLEGEIPRHIVDAKPLDLPHKLNPDSVGDMTNFELSAGKEDRKIYIREADLYLMTVSEKVKLFESTRRKVYVRRTTSPSISVAERVRWFESRTREIPSKMEVRHCTKVEDLQLETIARQEHELQREGEHNQSVGAQKRLFKENPNFNDDRLPIFENVRKPLIEVSNNVKCQDADRPESNDEIKEKGIVYRYREESECAKNKDEENALKQLKKTMVPHSRPPLSFGNSFFPQKSSKESTTTKSPPLPVVQRKERNSGNFKACSSPATSMR